MLSNRPPWASPETVVWTFAAGDDGVWVQRGDILWTQVSTVRAVGGVKTLGDVRAARSEIDWLDEWLVRYQDGAVTGDELGAIDDDADVSDEIQEAWGDEGPKPWDRESHGWLPDEVQRLADGSADGRLRFDDRDAVLTTLAGAGFDLVQDERPFRELLAGP